MQLIATGKWSKVKKGWMMVVALRRPSSPPAKRNGISARRPTRPQQQD
jgi:hypothetical protein